LSIYPDPDPEIVLEEVHSDLERNIGIARTHVVLAYDTSRANIHDVVDKWINVEEKVERECPEVMFTLCTLSEFTVWILYSPLGPQIVSSP